VDLGLGFRVTDLALGSTLGLELRVKDLGFRV
jgi:hypothetical protein